MQVSKELEAKCLALAANAPEPGPPLDCSEKEFQARVVALAKRYGWKAHHHTISKRSSPGWFDLVLARDGQVIFAELKTEKGKQTDEQKEWFESFRLAGLQVFVFRPRDWDVIAAILRARE